jgi:peptidoglycan/xylan/chitin deacetylase (PgdA/CDA1 family)
VNGRGAAVAALGGVGGLGGLALAAHMVPSAVSLGQWAPVRALPGELCRWRGPASASSGVALTFDDGPHPATTPLVLDRLDELGLVASFFCLGSLVAANPSLVGEILGRGHTVEVHGYRHDHHFIRTPRWVLADLRSALDVLRGAGARPGWYRPPYGQTTGASMYAARRFGLRLVLWSAWGHEWDAPSSSAVADRVIGALDPGAIVLLHDTDVLNPSGSTQRVLEALGPIASELDRAGLKAMTLDQLVGVA